MSLPPPRLFRTPSLLALLGALSIGSAFAQVESVFVRKGYSYIQTGPSTVTLDTSSNNYTFKARVMGPNLAGITPPVLSGPVVTANYCCWNAGKMAFVNDPDEPGWYMGTTGNEYGVSTLGLLNATFPNAVYTIVVNGVSVPLNLTGSTYPTAPTLRLSGGSWLNGQYILDPAQPLVVTTNPWSGYGTHVDDLITLPFAHQLASAVPGSNTLTSVIPANFLVAGNVYQMDAEFIAIVDKHPDPGLPGSLNSAGYSARTLVPLKTVAPIFPMTVTSNIGVTVSNATANIQYRPQDVGTTGSVYTFFLAPATKVLNASTEKGAWMGHMTNGTQKEASVQCVIAQLNSSGQLQAVSAANLQAYVTGVLSGAGQAITMLNNTLTANIAGTAIYVGYGQNALNMLTSGLNRRAVTVPGSVSCDPQAPQMGWWWNTAEGGRGYSIEVAGNHIFFASYLYDASGRASWYVASGNTSLDGSLFVGNLEGYSGGQPLSGAYKAPAPAVLSGALTLAFNDASHGTMTWPGGSVPIERFNIVPNGLLLQKGTNEPEGGWWFNPSEGGRGFFLEWQGGQLFMAGYMYDDSGNPIWYLSSNTSTNLQSYAGVWSQYGNGQTLTGAFKPATTVNANVGSTSIQFSGTENAVMTLPGGRTTSIRRFRF